MLLLNSLIALQLADADLAYRAGRQPGSELPRGVSERIQHQLLDRVGLVLVLDAWSTRGCCCTAEPALAQPHASTTRYCVPPGGPVTSQLPACPEQHGQGAAESS